MKYMNNHFCQSRIFGHAKRTIDLQLFAESGAEGGTGGGSEDPSDSDGQSGEENTPSIEELMAQLAEERAKSAKLQNEKDAASTDAANFKKQLRAKMSAQEQEVQAKAEAEAAKDAKIRELETKFRAMDYSKRYMGIGMEESAATELAGLTGEIADPDKFFSALDKFVKSSNKKAGEDSIQELIKNNPSVSAGNGESKGESLAVRKAKELAGQASGGVNIENLKQFM